MKQQFKNKVIIITGSTQGSGAETARLFASRGAKAITICGRQEDKAMEVKKDIESYGTECLFVKADLANVEDCINFLSVCLTIFIQSSTFAKSAFTNKHSVP